MVLNEENFRLALSKCLLPPVFLIKLAYLSATVSYCYNYGPTGPLFCLFILNKSNYISQTGKNLSIQANNQKIHLKANFDQLCSMLEILYFFYSFLFFLFVSHLVCDFQSVTKMRR